ncbi:MAG: hypothetical protein KJ571_05225 [Bacteroidetes bacterium]|nr:hypothetical protein [Bacteroidota bacterium]
MELIFVGIIVFLINLPFGLWRSKVNKYSINWFIAIHASIPIVYALRIYLGIEWSINSFVILIGAYLLGQYFGSKILRICVNKA